MKRFLHRIQPIKQYRKRKYRRREMKEREMAFLRFVNEIKRKELEKHGIGKN